MMQAAILIRRIRKVVNSVNRLDLPGLSGLSHAASCLGMPPMAHGCLEAFIEGGREHGKTFVDCGQGYQLQKF
jgi:hypothetical protein